MNLLTYKPAGKTLTINRCIMNSDALKRFLPLLVPI
jgi:hypothetical protein